MQVCAEDEAERHNFSFARKSRSFSTVRGAQEEAEEPLKSPPSTNGDSQKAPTVSEPFIFKFDSAPRSAPSPRPSEKSDTGIKSGVSNPGGGVGAGPTSFKKTADDGGEGFKFNPMLGIASGGVFTVAEIIDELNRYRPLKAPPLGSTVSIDGSKIIRLIRTISAAVFGLVMHEKLLAAIHKSARGFGVGDAALKDSLNVFSGILSLIFAIKFGSASGCAFGQLTSLKEAVSREYGNLRKCLLLSARLPVAIQSKIVEFVKDYSECVLEHECRPKALACCDCVQHLYDTRLAVDSALSSSGLNSEEKNVASLIRSSIDRLEDSRSARLSSFGKVNLFWSPFTLRVLGVTLLASCIPRCDKYVFSITTATFVFLDQMIGDLDGTTAANWSPAEESFVEARNEAGDMINGKMREKKVDHSLPLQKPPPGGQEAVSDEAKEGAAPEDKESADRGDEKGSSATSAPPSSSSTGSGSSSSKPAKSSSSKSSSTKKTAPGASKSATSTGGAKPKSSKPKQ
eukprot:CAMPEP_0184374810 /NCGR_PEP_ID=MMETSP1089-20130417/165223_1 /TAXON_ID=38269 ORGANISM="Gloeochaete wittrockiana, Strain SAG46.84" /NCGR_SAMPLE_ID=MMETSP1089 /ASSEMBLY_ACC=CAM_ASM_000445 /LENGTH=513 /DNA_ID=CAMNT_0026717845 /DNA_START=134 /DNA_END=1677 /DNA_ORIENTATION=-